jgi:hypothetical protein
MGVYEAIRAGNGVLSFLNANESKIDIGKPKTKSHSQQEIHLNNLIIKFGEDNEIKMIRNNSPKYKGNFSPFFSNCIEVQNNWVLFRKWIFENYSKELTLKTIN